MFLLFESSAGYALFKVSDRVTQLTVDELSQKLVTESSAREILDLVCFKKFKDMAHALQAASAVCDGELSKPLKKFLKSVICEGIDELGVADTKLGSLIQEKYQLNCSANSTVAELIRGVRSHFKELIAQELKAREFMAMSLALAHSLCRYKLKFNTDQLDTMVIQAVGLLEDLDREINNYVMRCREWYSWHFPELSKYFSDGLEYVKAVKCIGRRRDLDLRTLAKAFSVAQAHEIEQLSLHTMGTEITDADQVQISHLCTEIEELHLYRDSLYDYLQNRMNALAPSVTALVGEMVGAKMIAKAGSLVNLAKSASSTVQILGAEKALFRALKMHKETPKYGLIFHAQLVSNAPQKLKGKMARMLAAKVSLSARVDSFRTTETSDITMALNNRARLETRLKSLQGVNAKGASGIGAKQSSSWTPKSKARPAYDVSIDSTLPSAKARQKSSLIEEIQSAPASVEVMKKVRKAQESLDTSAGDASAVAYSSCSAPIEDTEEKKQKKKKKKKKHRQQQVESSDASETEVVKTKTEPVHKDSDSALAEAGLQSKDGERKKKKKKQRQQQIEGSDASEAEATKVAVVSVPEDSGVTVAEMGDQDEDDERKKKKKKRKQLQTSLSQDSNADQSYAVGVSTEASMTEFTEESFSKPEAEAALLSDDPEAAKKKMKKKKKKKKKSQDPVQ